MSTIKNTYGDLFPTDSPALMGAALGLVDGDRVLDIGGGHNPLPEATVVVEYDLTSGHDRDGHQINLDSRYIEGDAQDLQFEDGEFDFAYASHVFEHVRAPNLACSEMMRVARRGYIETPRKMTELYAGYPSHRWLVDVYDGVLTFERRWYIESPFQNALLAHVHAFDAARERALVKYRNLCCVQFPWNRTFQYAIIEKPGWQDLFDYDNSQHAAWSHFYFALNLLANGDHWSNVAIHARTAVKTMPSEAIFHLLEGVTHFLANKMDLAIECMQRAKTLQCTDAAVMENIRAVQADFDQCHLPMNRGTISRSPMR